jgi:CheY-like chemotaxis protein
MPAASDILIVDDDAPIVEFMTEALTDEGYTVRSAHDGTSALTEISRSRPALVLLDLHLNGMAGTEVLELLQSDGSFDVPVILMTADSQAAQRLAADGFRLCLLKPFDLDELLDCVAKNLPSSQMPQE